MLDNEISSVASVLGTNNTNLIYTFIACMLAITFWFLITKVLTPAGGLEYAQEGFASLCLKAAAVEKKYAEYDEDKVMAETGQKIREIIKQLMEEQKELEEADRWEKLTKLHWGVCAVVAYHKQYNSLSKAIKKFEIAATLTAYLRGAQLPTNDPLPV